MHISRTWALLGLLCCLASTQELLAQDTLRVMYYNLLNFPDSGDPNRDDTLANVFAYAQPDVLLVCELTSVAGANTILNKLNEVGEGPYQRATYIDNQSSSNNLQNMCYFRSDKLSLLSQGTVLTDLRDISEYRLFQVDGTTGDTVFVDFYMAHLKAASGSTNEALRLEEIQAFKTYLNSQPADRYRVFGGDLNFYRSTESGYQALLFDPPVAFADPISRPGSWTNSSSFADIHTQSTRTASFGGGATGGLDDRFDQILISSNIQSGTGEVRYVPGSYTTLGNDGLHFNQAVNSGTNLSAPADVIQSLYIGSDHLPVSLQLVLNSTPGGPEPVDCGDLFFSEYIEGSSNNKALEIYNPGPDAVDLGLYSVALYNNGNTTANSTAVLSGTLAAEATYQIVNSSADAALLGLADITSGVTFYNGDDAIALFRSGVLIDVIGEIGVDPGTNWPVGSGATSEFTLVRRPEIRQGQADWALGANEWLVYPQNTFSFYGSHTADPCEPEPTVCNDGLAPSGLNSSTGPSGVTLTWTPVADAVRCEVNGKPAAAPNFARIYVNVPPHQAFVPASRLSPGTTYQWKVRCACNLSPIDATPFSGLAAFTWPALRQQHNGGDHALQIFPNPASDLLQLSLPQAGLTTWTLYDHTGRAWAEGQLEEGQVSLSVRDWPAGVYWLRSRNSQGLRIDKVLVAH